VRGSAGAVKRGCEGQIAQSFEKKARGKRQEEKVKGKKSLKIDSMAENENGSFPRILSPNSFPEFFLWIFTEGRSKRIHRIDPSKGARKSPR
jgi:hypothetical protein